MERFNEDHVITSGAPAANTQVTEELSLNHGGRLHFLRSRKCRVNM
jgi:hypothetical protein